MEIRITIELLNAAGEVTGSEVVLGERDQDGLMGDVETALDALVSGAEDPE